MLAAKFGESEAVMAILESINSIEDIDIRENLLNEILGHTDQDNCTPLMLAAKGDKSDAVKAILNFVKKNNTDLLTEILGHTDKDGCTPLMLAAKGGHSAAVTAILNFVTDGQELLTTILNDTDKDGRTPLMLAAMGDKSAAVRAILNFVKRITPTYSQQFLTTQIKVAAPRSCWLLKVINQLP